jgi:hypothetical protein
MANSVYPPASRELSQKRRALAPDIEAAVDAFSQRVFADGVLPAKTKQVIAVAVAHVTQCPTASRDTPTIAATEPRRLRKKSYRSPGLLGMSGAQSVCLNPRSGFRRNFPRFLIGPWAASAARTSVSAQMLLSR